MTSAQLKKRGEDFIEKRLEKNVLNLPNIDIL